MGERSDLDSELFQAVRSGDISRVDELLRRGANIHATDHNGSAPLHAAAIVGRLSMVKHLVARGARVNARDGTGATPLDMALHASMNPTAGLWEGRASELSLVIEWLRDQKRWWQFWR